MALPRVREKCRMQQHTKSAAGGDLIGRKEEQEGCLKFQFHQYVLEAQSSNNTFTDSVKMMMTEDMTVQLIKYIEMCALMCFSHFRVMILC